MTNIRQKFLLLKSLAKWFYAATVKINLIGMREQFLTADQQSSKQKVSQLLATMPVTRQPLTCKDHLSGRWGAERRSGSNGRVHEVIVDAVCS